MSATEYISNDVIYKKYEDIINNFHSKYKNDILKILYSGKTSHHELAQKLNMNSDSNLTPLTKRLTDSEIIEKRQYGKYTQYELPDYTRMYVENNLLSSELISSDTETKAETFSFPLQKFKEQAGEDWMYIMLDFSIGQSSKYDSELEKLFQEFVKQIKQFIINNQKNVVNQVYEQLLNELLINKVKEYLEIQLQQFYNLKPLCELFRKDGQGAAHLIEDIFETQIKSNDPKFIEEKYAQYDFNNSQILLKIVSEIKEIILKAKNENWKKDAVECEFKENIPDDCQMISYLISLNYKELY